MDNLPELVYVRTNPHTGTHFIFDLLRYIDPEEFKFIGIHEGELFDYLREAVQKKISIRTMIRKILIKLNWPMTIKYLGLYEHLALPGTPPYDVSDVWIYDLTVNGIPDYPVKTIMPLRHYGDAVLTILIYHSISSLKERRDNLNWLRLGYEFMAYHDRDKEFYYIPVDVMGKRDVEYRKSYLRGLFQDFLGVKVEEEKLEKFIVEWQPAHTISELLDVDKLMKDNEEFRVLMEIKRDSDKNKRGLHVEFDEQMRYYESHIKIQQLFYRYGYFD